MAHPTLYVENLSLNYADKVIFSDLNLQLQPKKWVGLLGPSGVGKSSLLRLIAGLMLPNESWGGKIYTNNQLKVSEQIAYMAQTDLLLPWLTALDNALLKLKLNFNTSAQHKEITTQAKSLFERVGLKDAMHLYPHQLSGGMRQRVALVRTLLEDKPFVLMDEPFSALDAITRYKLQTLAAELLTNKTVLFITHDPLEALRLAHDIYVLQGQPATLKSIANLISTTPRECTDAEFAQMQALLFQELTQASAAA